MKRIYKSPGPNKLTAYCQRNPNNSWNQFRRSGKSKRNYKEIKSIIFYDQGGLCAYCEKDLKGVDSSLRRVEHYKSKKHAGNSNNLALDWWNIIGVCIGGEDYKAKYPESDWRNMIREDVQSKYITCDSHKERLEKDGLVDSSVDGYALNPLSILNCPSLFLFDKTSGFLKPNADACAGYNVNSNAYGTVQELVEKTIYIFNLNSKRLCDERLLVFDDYVQKVRFLSQRNKVDYKKIIAGYFFSKKWPEYFTVKRLLLGKAAEDIISQLESQ